MRGWQAIVLAVTGMVLTTSCGYAAAINSANISQEKLVGTWTSPAGTSLTFSKDHTFTGTGFGNVEAMSGCAHRETLSGGRWAFYVSPDGDGLIVPDESAPRGNDLELSFPDDPSCTVWVYLYGSKKNPSMCPTKDPDAGCPMGGYLKKDEVASPS